MGIRLQMPQGELNMVPKVNPMQQKIDGERMGN
jgi:hypothetical protein